VRSSFKKDFFFDTRVSWSEKNLLNKKEFRNIKDFFSKKKIGNLVYVKKKIGIEANSQNFKIKIKNNHFLLKKWPINKDLGKINATLNLQKKLIELNSETPEIVKIDKKNFFKIDNRYWTLFKFINSNHFSGSLKEYKILTLAIGRLLKTLKKIRTSKKVKQIEYYKKSNLKIFKMIISKKSKWKKIFGISLSKKLNTHFDKIEKIYYENSNFKYSKNLIQLSHIDLHPHNILISSGKNITFLDIDSCLKVNPGFALSFCCLKICKQVITKNKIKNPYDQKKISKIFLKQVAKKFPDIKKLFPYFYFFSTSEVLRRILLIFDQNLKGINTWNKVLNIQINHLNEARILFK